MLGKLCGEIAYISLYLVQVLHGTQVVNMDLYLVRMQLAEQVEVIILPLDKMRIPKIAWLLEGIILALVKTQPTTTKVVKM